VFVEGEPGLKYKQMIRSGSPLKKELWRILVLAVVVVGLAIYYVLNFTSLTEPLSPVGKPQAVQTRFETTWQSEDDWIIRSILSDIYGMIVSHAHPGQFAYEDLSIDIQQVQPENVGNRQKPTRYKIEAELPQIREKIVLELNIEDNGAHIYSPQLYWDWTMTLVDLMAPALSSIQPSNDNETVLLRSLLSPTTQILEKENQNLSRRLSKNILSAPDQYAAALLVGMLSMREASGRFHDLRSHLCRMTAHLSIAWALAPRSNENALEAITFAIHHLLMNNQVLALNEITALDTKGKNNATVSLYRAWKDALYTRITADWRMLEAKPMLSLLERMELFRALCLSWSTNRALAWVSESDAHQIPFNEAARVVAMNEYSVGTGHSLLKNSPSAELRELYDLLGQDNLPSGKDELAVYLNQTGTYAVYFDEDYAPHLQIISTGAWTHFFQRHFMHRIEAEYHFYKWNWGVNEIAQDFYRNVRDNFSGLNLFPVFMRVAQFDTADTAAAFHELNEVVEKAPELLTAQCFLPFQPMRGEIWPQGTILNLLKSQWYIHGLLPGTIYQLKARIACFIDRSSQLPYYEKALAVAPYDLETIDLYCGAFRKDDRLKKDELENAYAPVRDYNVRALRKLAERYTDQVGAMDKGIETYQRLCRLDPVYYFELGKWLKLTGRKEEAAKAYQQGVNRANDPLLVANKSDWLVMYYHEKGETKKAIEIAEIGAQVGSYLGFWTMAELLDRMGDAEGAERYYRKIYKRYQDPGVLLRFLRKHESDPAVQAKIDMLLNQIFTGGLQMMTLKEATNPPQTGVIIIKSLNWMRQSGLAPGDIIVAINGYSVSNMEQFLAAKEYSQPMTAELIVWQRSRFREVQIPKPDSDIVHILTNYKSGD
jgi:tetratricopeptide (TPR) repeat protein